jgi:hypothetical protein
MQLDLRSDDLRLSVFGHELINETIGFFVCGHYGIVNVLVKSVRRDRGPFLAAVPTGGGEHFLGLSVIQILVPGELVVWRRQISSGDFKLDIAVVCLGAVLADLLLR